jgi:hypothetical protein
LIHLPSLRKTRDCELMVAFVSFISSLYLPETTDLSRKMCARGVMMVIIEGGREASAPYRHDYTLCDRLSALPYRLNDGCIVPAATEKGGH